MAELFCLFSTDEEGDDDDDDEGEEDEEDEEGEGETFLQLNSKIFTVKPIQVWSLLFYRFIIILPYTQNIHVKF